MECFPIASSLGNDSQGKVGSDFTWSAFPTLSVLTAGILALIIPGWNSGSLLFLSSLDKEPKSYQSKPLRKDFSWIKSRFSGEGGEAQRGEVIPTGNSNNLPSGIIHSMNFWEGKGISLQWNAAAKGTDPGIYP